MLKLLFPLSILMVLSKAHGPMCYLGVAPGTSVNCDNSPSQRFHFDPDLNECHAFQYNGCGGNRNNYETMEACVTKCIGDWKKYFACSLGRNPIFNSNGSPQCPVSETGEGCDNSEATCVNFYTMGICCNKTVETGLLADKSSTCPSGKPRYQQDGVAWLAKICDDMTCPTGYSCQQGNFFAFCCQD